MSETKTMPEVREFELFYSGFTGGLIVRPIRSAMVMLANNQSDDEYIDVIEKKAYSALKAECERLKSGARLHDTIVTQLQRGHKAYADKLESENAKLKEQNAGLIEALRFYAEERNWTDGMNYWEEFQLTPCGDDFGKKANSALKKWGGV